MARPRVERRRQISKVSPQRKAQVGAAMLLQWPSGYARPDTTSFRAGREKLWEILEVNLRDE
jgi:hypothetical protein